MASKRVMRRRVRVAALALTLVLAAALAACGSDDKGADVSAGSGDGSSTSAASVKAPSGDPSITGPVTKVTTGDGLVTFLIQDGKDPSGTALAARVKVPASTSVLRSSGISYTKASAADLQDGAAVKVWFTGPVAESYPVQATAGTVVITS